MISNKHYKFLLLTLCFFLYEKAYTSNNLENYDISNICFNQNNKCFKLKIADTEEKRRIGLMNIKSISKYDGMIFIYGAQSLVDIWMLNTYIKLDLIFLKDEMIIKIIEEVKPCIKKPCKIYRHNQPIDTLIELKGGFVNRYNLKVGDKIKSNQINLK